jgi:putative hydrolase of the HAD superfamily
MLPRAIFFDLDDTLLDTSGGLDEAWRITCERYGRELGMEADTLRTAIREEANTFWKDEAAVGHWRVRLFDARVHVVDLALRKLGANLKYALPVARQMEDERTARLRLFDDTIETLDWLRESGYRLALLTNGPAEMQRDKLARFPIGGYFEAVVIEGEFGAGKPDPAVFHHALGVTGAAPHEAWHVGDNLYADIGGAHGVGAEGVWIHRDRLEQAPWEGRAPDRVIGHLGELRAALESLA